WRVSPDSAIRPRRRRTRAAGCRRPRPPACWYRARVAALGGKRYPAPATKPAARPCPNAARAARGPNVRGAGVPGAADWIAAFAWRGAEDGACFGDRCLISGLSFRPLGDIFLHVRHWVVPAVE